MSDIFERIAQRALGVAPAVHPVVPSLWSGFPTFEDSVPSSEPSLTPLSSNDRIRELEAQAPAPAPALEPAQAERKDSATEPRPVRHERPQLAVSREPEAPPTEHKVEPAPVAQTTTVVQERAVEVERAARLVSAAPPQEIDPLRPVALGAPPELLLPALSPASAERSEPLRPEAPTPIVTPPPQQTHVQVSIGRIEVRAIPKRAMPERRRPRTSEDRSRLSLRDYLASGGERS